jgi:hypothetical protein
MAKHLRINCSFSEFSDYVKLQGGDVRSPPARGNNCWYYASEFFSGACFPLNNIEQYDDFAELLREVINVPSGRCLSEEDFRKILEIVGVSNVAVLTNESGGIAMHCTSVGETVDHIAILSIDHYHMVDLRSSQIKCNEFFKEVCQVFGGDY